MAEYRYDSSKGETPPVIINGPAPVDQSALLANAIATINAMKTAASAAVARDAANVEGQSVLDAAKAGGF